MTYTNFYNIMARYYAEKITKKFQYDPVSVFATSKINPLPYQLEDFLSLANTLDVGIVRALLSYETGLGKTIVSGLLIRELLYRKKDSRVLLLVPPPAVMQWKAEMRAKFGLEFHEYTNENDLSKNLLIASIDTLKRKKKAIEERGTRWDLIVVDELHRATPVNMRYELLKFLSENSTVHFLGLTATPHDGKEANFIGRLQLIQPSVNEENYRIFLEEANFRRLKSEVTDIEGNALFPYGVNVNTINIKVTPEEERFYSAVEEYVRKEYGKAEGRNSPRGLIATVMGRIASSSVYAAIAAMKRRKEKILKGALIGPEDYINQLLSELREAEENELEMDGIYRKIIETDTGEDKMEELSAIDKVIEAGMGVKFDSKLQQLKQIINLHREKGHKVVVFTSFIDTTEYLREKLSEEFGSSVYAVNGNMDRDERDQSIKKFLESGIVLIGTEVIGESLNLQKANVVVNYEMPWSPVTYIQRVGRVYRYPQRSQIFVHNFSSTLKVERRIIDIIYQKVNRMVENFDEGSVAVIGSMISDQDVAQAIFDEYKKGELDGERVIRQKLSDADHIMQIVKTALDNFKAAAVHVNAFSILGDPRKIVTEEDIKNFLDYAKMVGIGEGDHRSRIINYQVHGRPVKELTVEDPAIIDALNTALKLPVAYASAVWKGETTDACLLNMKYIDGNGETILEEQVLYTPAGYSDSSVIETLTLPHQSAEVRTIEQGEPSKDPFIRNRLSEISDKVIETSVYKMQLIDKRIQVLEGYKGPMYEKEISDLEHEKLKLGKRADIRVELGDIIGYLRLVSEREAAREAESGDRYDPELEKIKREIEIAAMEYVMNYERQQGWEPEDVSRDNLGYDIISRKQGEKKYIEVKGLSVCSGTVVLTTNEIKASEFFKDDFYLYVVCDPKGSPTLKIKKPPLEVVDQRYVVQYIVKF